MDLLVVKSLSLISKSFLALRCHGFCFLLNAIVHRLFFNFTVPGCLLSLFFCWKIGEDTYGTFSSYSSKLYGG